jgi:nitrite reductase/ring-hydroxylating ferredoxin subunit
MKMGSIPVANPSPPQRLGFPRRGLRIVVVLATITIASIVVLSFAWPTGSKVDQVTWFTVGRASDFAVSDPVRFPEQRFWLVRLESGEFIALWQKSPYRGCTIPWRPDFEFMGKKGWFRDPCHNDTFAIDGAHVFGPAPRGMDRFPVRIDKGIVSVNLQRVIQGPAGPPQ